MGDKIDYSKLCDTPLYAGQFEILNGYQQYYDYEQALQCAREQHKLLIVIFGGHSCLNARKLEFRVLSDDAIKKIINEHCILVSLYCDDMNPGKNGMTLGEHNLQFEEKRFGEAGQPLVMFLDNNEKELGRTRYGFKEGFLEILIRALAAFK